MEKTYLQIGSIRLYNIKVIYNNEIIFEGSTENLPEEYKTLKYYKIVVNSDIITLYTTN